MPETLEWKEPPSRSNRLLLFVVILAFVVLVVGRTAISYYVDGLWFGSLGYGGVFRRTLILQWSALAIALVTTFSLLYGWMTFLRRTYRFALPSSHPILINGHPVSLPVDRFLKAATILVASIVSLGSGLTAMAQWPIFALYWSSRNLPHAVYDPVFGKPLEFYFFTLPVYRYLSGWFLVIAFLACVLTGFFLVLTGGARLLSRGRTTEAPSSLRAFSVVFALLLFAISIWLYLSRFGQLYQDHTIFSGATYTDIHVTIPGTLIVSIALALGALLGFVNVVTKPKVRWIFFSMVPAIACFLVMQLLAWYTTSFLVKPNELVRERPFILRNIEMTRQAYGLDRIARQEFPTENTVEALDAQNNRATLDNIRLWDWRALQDTLRQIQEIRTYYDFPGVDIDRYQVNGTTREVMVGVRELNLDKLPEGSRNWINEKIIYTHGYGLTMNPVNGFTAEGLPTLMLSNMPVQSTSPELNVKRPEIYFGELTNSDIYVKTRQQEFNYPQGQTNNMTSYQGTGGIELGGLLRRLLIAFDRGDLAKLPFSDDIGSQSRILMRRNIRERVQALAPFLRYDQDPYAVIGEDGRVWWMMDAFTSSDSYPYSRHYRAGDENVNYLRNSVKVLIDAYNGDATFYIFDKQDPVIAAYRNLFPELFQDASKMPASLRQHVRYPELLLKVQAAAYGLYHMSDPEVFYNREDLWTVATEVGMGDSGEQKTLAMDPNFVLMKLPNQSSTEFVGILPFTPSNRNNLVGWLAGRSDGEHYGTLAAYDFPKTKLVDGPLQIEARIDQNAQLSGQLTLWNQQGSHVRRGSLLVIPCGRSLLYAEPIYLQAERSPMPELRLVVLALQDRLVYGPTYAAALSSLFGGEASSLNETAVSAPDKSTSAPETNSNPAEEQRALIAGAARDLSDYQRLTAEGKLADAGQKLEQLKRKLEKLNAQQK